MSVMTRFVMYKYSAWLAGLVCHAGKMLNITISTE